MLILGKECLEREIEREKVEALQRLLRCLGSEIILSFESD